MTPKKHAENTQNDFLGTSGKWVTAYYDRTERSTECAGRNIFTDSEFDEGEANGLLVDASQELFELAKMVHRLTSGLPMPHCTRAW